MALWRLQQFFIQHILPGRTGRVKLTVVKDDNTDSKYLVSDMFCGMNLCRLLLLARFSLPFYWVDLLCGDIFH